MISINPHIKCWPINTILIVFKWILKNEKEGDCFVQSSSFASDKETPTMQERRKAGNAVMNKTNPYRIRGFVVKRQQK